MDFVRVKLLSVIGFVMMVLGLVVYIVNPLQWAQYVFILGFVALIASYVLTYLSAKAADAVYEEIESLEESGYIYVLDQRYVSSVNDATITDLTRK